MVGPCQQTGRSGESVTGWMYKGGTHVLPFFVQSQLLYTLYSLRRLRLAVSQYR